MFLSILILILLLPVVFLPLALDTFFSPNDLNEMGICLEKPETLYPMRTAMSLQGFELVGVQQRSNDCEGIVYPWGGANNLKPVSHLSCR
jgi:hypothetical protein